MLSVNLGKIADNRTIINCRNLFIRDFHEEGQTEEEEDGIEMEDVNEKTGV